MNINTLVTGYGGYALGINTKMIASGICTGSFKLPYDALSDLLGNPIKSCIFCTGGKCYYSGDCERRKPLDREDP